ncbi:MAG: hypothetical protein COT00_01395 [Candidatus Omnitrophica bacterium CG07_land_8_20_14_0_80_50_8]|nr:MAG: hypothetical protein COT00_01395 [Candidatus Omnitrophica bacterium CG07_land_8_20_14_0_80_50_8]
MGNMPKCAECQTESFAFDRAFACAVYEGTMRQLIHAYKFQNRKYLKHYFIRMMLAFIHSHLAASDFDIILPVPMDRGRRSERGFNQSELISSAIAKYFKISHSVENLVRLQGGQIQSQLEKKQRKLNVKNAFLVRKADTFHSRRLLLIDDILTTGYTASECARCLKKSGAARVTVLALARGVN